MPFWTPSDVAALARESVRTTRAPDLSLNGWVQERRERPPSGVMNSRRLHGAYPKARDHELSVLLFLAKRAADLVVERLDEKGHHGAGAGLNKAFHRHAGYDLQAFQALNLARRDRDAHGVITAAGFL